MTVCEVLAHVTRTAILCFRGQHMFPYTDFIVVLSGLCLYTQA